MQALGATGVAGLSACGAAVEAPSFGRSTSRISDGYSDQRSYRPGDRVTLFLNVRFPLLNTRFPRVRLYDYGGRIVYHEFVADLPT